MSISRTKIASLGISAALFVSVAVHEGYVQTSMIPVPGDAPTIGMGRTEGVKMGDTTNPVREMVYLLNNLEGKYGAGVKKCVTVPLYQHEYEAYVSLAYNIGVGAFCNSTLVKKLNAGDYAGACQEISRWDRFKGKPLAGLTKRRAEERSICEGRA